MLYIYVYACVYCTCCVDPSDHVVIIVSYLRIACWVYWYSKRIIELRHCAYSIHIARYSAACHCTHHTCSCDTHIYTYRHIQTHALHTIALIFDIFHSHFHHQMLHLFAYIVQTTNTAYIHTYTLTLEPQSDIHYTTALPTHTTSHSISYHALLTYIPCSTKLSTN